MTQKISELDHLALQRIASVHEPSEWARIFHSMRERAETHEHAREIVNVSNVHRDESCI